MGCRSGTPGEIGGTVERNELESGSKGFGRYLRRVREGRRLSLDAVEEMSADYPERLTKSHLSRIETGQALPTFPRLFALSRIYGVPVTTLAERFELELQRGMTPIRVEGRTDEEVTAEARARMDSGRYFDALLLISAMLDSRREAETDPERRARAVHWKLGLTNCLVRLGRYESAKNEAEQLLSERGLSDEQRLMALQFFITCCFELQRFTVAMMGIDRADAELETVDVPPRMKADFAMIRGNLLVAMGRHAEAMEPYGRALESYDSLPSPFEACRTRINMAYALMEARKDAQAESMLERALTVAEPAGYDRQKALALSHLAVLRYRRGDFAGAETLALRSNAVARSREFLAVVFRNCYYLWRIALDRGDGPAARAHERTLRSYVGRLEEHLPEAEAFRAHLSGGVA